MKEKINVYLFWGHGCPHCEIAKLFFKKIESELGNYYNLVLIETWENEDNEKLLNMVADELNKPAKTVPYIVIGNHVYGVINNIEVKNDIKETIIKEFNNPDYEDIIEKIKVNV
jgi:glutaredoxin